MPISKEDDKSLWEQYHIIFLSHMVLYCIWSLLDLDESLVVTRVSRPIFGLQLCYRLRKRMQLNIGGLRLNTLYLYSLFIIFIFSSFSFSSISLPSTVYISSFSIFSFSLCWSLLACLGVINFNFISCSHASKGTFIKIDRFKIKPCPSQKKMTRFRGSNIPSYFSHLLSCTAEFDPCLIQMKAWC